MVAATRRRTSCASGCVWRRPEVRSARRARRRPRARRHPRARRQREDSSIESCARGCRRGRPARPRRAVPTARGLRAATQGGRAAARGVSRVAHREVSAPRCRRHPRPSPPPRWPPPFALCPSRLGSHWMTRALHLTVRAKDEQIAMLRQSLSVLEDELAARESSVGSSHEKLAAAPRVRGKGRAAHRPLREAAGRAPRDQDRRSQLGSKNDELAQGPSRPRARSHAQRRLEEGTLAGIAPTAPATSAAAARPVWRKSGSAGATNGRLSGEVATGGGSSGKAGQPPRTRHARRRQNALLRRACSSRCSFGMAQVNTPMHDLRGGAPQKLSVEAWPRPHSRAPRAGADLAGTAAVSIDSPTRLLSMPNSERRGAIRRHPPRSVGGSGVGRHADGHWS